MTNLKVIAPKWCDDFLSPGKEYGILGICGEKNDVPFGRFFQIVSNKGTVYHCRERNCIFANGQNWDII